MHAACPATPFPAITCPEPWDWETDRLTRGHRYRVIKAFADAHGQHHAIGEQWTFLGTTFHPQGNDLILLVSSVLDEERTISLRWAPDAQRDIILNHHHYLAAALPLDATEC